MRWPIRYQILLPLAGIMLAAVLGVSMLSAYLAAERAERQIDEQLQQVARTLLDSSFPLNDSVLRQMHGLSGAEFALADDQGRVLAASQRSLPLPLAATPVERWQDLQLVRPAESDEPRYFTAALKMRGRGAQAEPLVLYILYPETHRSASRREAAFPPLAIGAVALLVFTLLAALIAARLSRPIHQLRAQVARLAQGDFRTWPLPQRNDELQDLAEGINALAERLEEMRRTIGRSERLALLGQLSGGLAHDLRNDVTGARMAVQLHRRSCRQGDVESLDVALRQLALTEEHLQRFLAAGQPEQLKPVPCRIGEIVETAVKLIEPACRHRKVELTVSPQKATENPSETSPAQLEADPEQLRHVLMNLLLNALEAAGSSGWVRIEYGEPSEGACRVRVLDSGAGPPADFVERLFEPFSTTKPEGVGLGLAVARRVTELHGGRLDYTRLDGATCFELTLPIRTRSVSEDQQIPIRSVSEEPTSPTRSASEASRPNRFADAPG
ncbi:MAG TPA: ATP-binding protein [Pirellulales bacterium]|nr:ATP-binding protein [Pirellulales bacterium]